MSNAEWKTGARPDFTAVKDHGIFYVLDEVHIAFNARAWADTGHEVLYYLSQHRKLGDDVVCITQAINNVDKQFRSVAQDFTYIRNLSKQKAGVFRLPAMFIRSTYAQPATDTSKPMETGTFKLDVSGLASLYDTAKGVGIHGRAGADTNARKRGIHWLWFVVGLPVLLWLVFHYLPLWMTHLMNPHESVVKQKTVATAPVVSPPPRRDESPVEVSLPRSEVSTPSVTIPGARPVGGSPLETNEIYCTGFAIIPGHKPVVYLSDGSTAYGDDGEVQEVRRHAVTVFGKNYRIRTMVPPVVPDVAPAPAPGGQWLPPAPVNQASVIDFGDSRSPSPSGQNRATK